MLSIIGWTIDVYTFLAESASVADAGYQNQSEPRYFFPHLIFITFLILSRSRAQKPGIISLKHRCKWLKPLSFSSFYMESALEDHLHNWRLPSWQEKCTRCGLVHCCLLRIKKNKTKQPIWSYWIENPVFVYLHRGQGEWDPITRDAC